MLVAAPVMLANLWIPLGLALGSEYPSIALAVFGSSLAAINGGLVLWYLLLAWRSTNEWVACLADVATWSQFAWLVLLLLIAFS